MWHRKHFVVKSTIGRHRRIGSRYDVRNLALGQLAPLRERIQSLLAGFVCLKSSADVVSIRDHNYGVVCWNRGNVRIGTRRTPLGPCVRVQRLIASLVSIV